MTVWNKDKEKMEFVAFEDFSSMSVKLLGKKTDQIKQNKKIQSEQKCKFEHELGKLPLLIKVMWYNNTIIILGWMEANGANWTMWLRLFSQMSKIKTEPQNKREN